MKTKFDHKMFHSKIARRIFVLFVSCALIPILCLSIVSYIRVTKQLREQGFKLLKQSVTGYAYSVYERLIFLDTELQLMASSVNAALNDPGQISMSVFNERLKSRFKAAVVFNPVDGYVPVYKVMKDPGKLSASEIKHINAGKTAVLIKNHQGYFPQIIMVRLVDPKKQSAGYLMGEINPSYLWSIDQGDTLPPATEVSVLDTSRNLLFSSHYGKNPLLKKADLKFKNSVSGQFESANENGRYLASYRKIFLSSLFLVDEWTFVLSQSKGYVLKPMADFKKIFPAIVLLALWVVLILSSYNIRKSLVPLEILKKGTRQITMNKFDSKINLTSGDEFEELAMDFNKMASELNKQFKTLDTKAEIDRAILSSLDARIIVETIIYRIYDWFDCDSVSIGLMDSKHGNTARIYSSIYDQRKELFENSIEFKPSDLETFNSHPEYMILYADKNRLPFLSTFVEQGIELFLILPIFIKEHLKALITIGRSQSNFYNAEDIFQARQMADQVAVSLSNATLMEEMDNLGWGAIKALARTVDAKSSWTAGHSTRVAKMALRLGAELGISSKKLEDLHRAALLHDVGKIGVPLSILDKPGPLDDDEYAMIKKHPAIGARILEPIASYADIIPIVLQHHERFDGKGYPGGISGNEIDIGARILAVADVYDALISDRPYRKGWAIENVIGLIRKEAGRQFDPDVAGVFLAIMRQRKTKAA